MYHFEKKNSKLFSPEGPRENVWGPCENVSPGPAVALDGPVIKLIIAAYVRRQFCSITLVFFLLILPFQLQKG